ncbi:MAG: DUF2339 domain-containing protein [Chloroflexi bacterium]|nr:DUF2339 domain-containing protein [Chloroflexota bacterium]
MRCPSCGHDNPSGGRFCILCGTPLEAAAGGPAASSPEAPVRSLEDEVHALHRTLLDLTDRVAAVERVLGFSRQPALPQPPAPPPPSPQPVQPAAAATSGPTGEGAPLEAAAVTAGPEKPPYEGAGAAPGGPLFPGLERIRGWDWEQVLGGNWFARIGALALIIGVGFFLKLAFENNWIGETGRVILGMVVGVALLGAGEYWQRRYPTWAHAVTGGGIGIIYLSIYAAFGFYHLIGPLPAFLFLALVTALAGLLALRYEALTIAVLGVLGGFLTPVLLGRDRPDDRLLLTYILVLDLGILGVAAFRNWRWLTLLGLVGSVALFGPSLVRVSPDEVWLRQVGYSLIFLTFVGATTLFHVLWRRAPGASDMALMTINAAVYFGVTYRLLWDRYEVWFGVIGLGLALFYGMVGYAALKRRGAPPQVALYSVAIALVFLTVAVPLQLGGAWITIAWAAEGAVLIWVGFTLRSWPLRAYGLAVFAIVAARLVFFDTPVDLRDFRPVLNDRFPTFVVAIAAAYLVAYLYLRDRRDLRPWEVNLFPLLVGAANLFTLWAASAELISYFDSRSLAGTSSQLHQDALNKKHLSLTVLWTFYAVGLLAVAAGWRSLPLRVAGLALLAVPALKLIFLDAWVVDLAPLGFRLILNFSFLAFVLVVAAVYFAAYLYWRQRDELAEGEGFVFPVLLMVANFLSLWALSAEVIRFFDARGVPLRTDFDSAKHLSLTLLWAVYGVVGIAVGVVAKSRPVRLAGMALLMVPILKLFAFDVFLLERGFRVAAFVTLGALLLGTGFAYQRYRQAVRGFLFG